METDKISMTEALEIAEALKIDPNFIVNRTDCNLNQVLPQKLCVLEDVPLYLGIHNRLDEAVYHRLNGHDVSYEFYDDFAWSVCDSQAEQGWVYEEEKKSWDKPTKNIFNKGLKRNFRPLKRTFRTRGR